MCRNFAGRPFSAEMGNDKKWWRNTSDALTGAVMSRAHCNGEKKNGSYSKEKADVNNR